MVCGRKGQWTVTAARTYNFFVTKFSTLTASGFVVRGLQWSSVILLFVYLVCNIASCNNAVSPSESSSYKFVTCYSINFSCMHVPSALSLYIKERVIKIKH